MIKKEVTKYNTTLLILVFTTLRKATRKVAKISFQKLKIKIKFLQYSQFDPLGIHSSLIQHH